MNKILNVSAILISLIAIVAVFGFNYSGPKEIYYVDNGKLYDEFILKKEYEKQIQNMRIVRRNIIDSMEFELNKLQNSGNKVEFEYLKAEYVEKMKIFEEEEENLLNEYNSQIWKRLNQYAIEYGKSNNIDFLFGSSGDGSLMHINDKYNKTAELIIYANKRYTGK